MVLPGFHTEVGPPQDGVTRGRAPQLPGFHTEVGPLRMVLPGFHTEVGPLRMVLPGFHTEVRVPRDSPI